MLYKILGTTLTVAGAIWAFILWAPFILMGAGLAITAIGFFQESTLNLRKEDRVD